MPRKVAQRESAIAVISDCHFGAHTPSFDPDVCRRRMEEWVGRVARLIDMQRGTVEIDELIVAVMGDVNDGNDIYKTHPHHVAISNVEQQANEVAATVLVPAIRALGQLVPRVKVKAVRGNHGRSGRFAHEAQSWDVVAYRYAALRLEQDKNIEWKLEITPPRLRILNVRGHGILLFHGDSIKMYQSIPWYGIANRVLRWTSARGLPAFEVMHLGHFHSFGMWDINDITVLANGTMKTDDAWALEELGWESATKWWFHGVSDSRALTWAYGVDTAEDVAPAVLSGEEYVKFHDDEIVVEDRHFRPVAEALEVLEAEPPLRRRRARPRAA